MTQLQGDGESKFEHHSDDEKEKCLGQDEEGGIHRKSTAWAGTACDETCTMIGKETWRGGERSIAQRKFCRLAGSRIELTSVIPSGERKRRELLTEDSRRGGARGPKDLTAGKGPSIVKGALAKGGGKGKFGGVGKVLGKDM